jgi:hypothetical protein
VHYWGEGGRRDFDAGLPGFGPDAGAGLLEGDTLVSNHPQLAGGSHLPDITVRVRARVTVKAPGRF